MIHIEFMLGLGEKNLAGVVIGQQFAADQGLAAVAFAKQHPRLVFALPTQKHGTATVLEQQQRRHGNRGDVLQLALQDSPLQAGAGRCTGQQLDTQALLGQRQARCEHGRAGGFLVQHAQSEQTIQQRIIMQRAWIMAEINPTDF
ncbi:hypothetical protein D3C72_1820700 [compost metagenome]